jgi:hypothetical protein
MPSGKLVGTTLKFTGREVTDGHSHFSNTKVDEDHHATGRLLLKKLTSLSPPSGGPTPSPAAVPPLTTSMVIWDEQGNLCCTLGDLLRSPFAEDRAQYP